MQWIKQSESAGARKKIAFFIVSSTDGTTPQTGITTPGTSEIQVQTNGGTWTNFAGTWTEAGGAGNGAGYYVYEPTVSELGTLGTFAVKFARTGCRTRIATALVISFSLYDGVAGRQDVNVGAIGNDVITVSAIQDNAITANKIATNAITSTKIAANAIGSSQIATDAIGSAQLAASAASEIGDAVWNTTISGHTTTGTFGQRLSTNVLGTVSASGSNTALTFLTNRAEAVNDYWKDCLIVFLSGALQGQVKKISAYNGSTKFVTVASAFTAAPATSDAFMIINS